MTNAEIKEQDAIKEMMGYLTPHHRQNIHSQAFDDISKIFLEFVDEYRGQFEMYIENTKNEESENLSITPVSWVCNASMGHGKTTVLVSFLKWLVSEKRLKFKVPVLLAIRENNMADEIFRELKAFDEHCVLRIDKDTKKEQEQYVPNYQIVIITHARLKHITLGYGNMQHYRLWKQYPMNLFTKGETVNDDDIISKRNRLLIVDEKPDFVNSSVFDIGSHDNSVDWFEKLSGCLDFDSFKSQSIKSQIINLIAFELAENTGSITTALVPQDERKSKRIQNLSNTLKEIEKNAVGYDILHMEKLKAFQKLLFHDGIARIDEYKVRSNVGRKIIYAERINYTKLNLNILVLDGTCRLTRQQYKGFKPKLVKNYNNYFRLTITQDIINTSVWSRQKTGTPTQKAIDVRVKELRHTYKNLFVLPIKEDIKIYSDLGSISSEHRDFFENKSNEQSSPINLLNTTGKNHLKDVTALYLTSLPRRHPDHFKAIAISLYGNNVNLDINDEGNSISWFNDMKLEGIYRGELYAELLQIIHRTALRKIKESTPINVFIAFDDTRNDALLEDTQVVLREVNDWYFKQANIKKYRVTDESLYNRGEIIRQFAEDIDKWVKKNTTFFNSLPRKLSHIDPQQETGERFRKWLTKNNNWENKKDLIDRIFRELNYVIYTDPKAKRATKMITTLKDYEDNFGDYMIIV
jgi:hypothetical protein